MSPNENAVNAAPSDIAHLLLNYYINCAGDNQIGVYVQQLLSTNVDISYLLSSNLLQEGYVPSGSCNIVLNEVNSFAGGLNQTIKAFSVLAQCYSFNQIWFDFSNVGICGKFFSGMFTIWLCISISTVLMFVVICMSNKLFIRFDFAEDDSCTIHNNGFDESSVDETYLECGSYSTDDDLPVGSTRANISCQACMHVNLRSRIVLLSSA
jgi:hypothetical protein